MWSASFVLDRVGDLRPADAPVVVRGTVKAIIVRGDRLLLVSTNAGDVKFPGGGPLDGEDVATCLRREVAEECGRLVDGVGDVVCRVRERRPDRDGRSVFELRSRYLTASVTDVKVAQALDDYEAELGMAPVWVTVSDALAANVAHLEREQRAPSVHREITVLAHLCLLPVLPTVAG